MNRRTKVVDRRDPGRPFTPQEREQIRKLKRSSNRKWFAITVWIILFTLFAFWSFRGAREARIKSCKVAVESTRAIFRPFFVGNPPAQIKRFNDSVDDQKELCEKVAS